MAFFDKNNAGELNSIMTGNLESLKNTINFKFSDFICKLSRGISCLTYALIVAWKFSIVFLAIVPFMIITINLLIKYLKKYSKKEFISYGSSGKVAQESLSSLRTILSFGIQHKAIKTYNEKLVIAENVSIKKGLLTGIFEGIFYFLFNLLFGIGIYYMVHLYQTDPENYNPGNLMPAFFCMVTCSSAIGLSIPFISDIGESKGVAVKVMDMINKKSKIDIQNTNTNVINDLQGNITFENVHFNYPQRPDAKILQGLTINIPAGKTVAFVGAR